MARQLLFFSLAICFCVLAKAQDPVFSQFYAAPLQLNPAFAGVTYAPRITLNYRNQWPALGNAYVTYAASYEHPIENLNSGIGFSIMADDAGQGLYKTNYFSAIYGYKVQITDEFFMKLGVEAGLFQSLLDWERYRFPDQIDPIDGFQDPSGNPFNSEEVPPTTNGKTNFDISAGILAYSRFFYLGLSVKHLNSPDESILAINQNLDIGRPMRFTFHAGAEISLESGNNGANGAFISPNVMYIDQGDFGQVNAGFYMGLDRFFSGLWYRHAMGNGDAAIALVGVRQGIFRIGYSFDLTISGLASYSGGAHEVSLTINFDESRSVKSRRRASRYNDCFKMFK